VRHSLSELAGRLLIQCRPGQVAEAVETARVYSSGIVLTSSSDSRPEIVVRQLRDNGFDGPILCDAGRYSGRRRIGAGRGIRPAWCRRQQDLGLIALTDSGYVENGNWFGLRTILRAAAMQAPPVIAMVPLSARWFAMPSVANALTQEINKFDVPVALAIEHGKDPFSAQYLVRGVLQLIRAANVPVLLLRSDVSAIGALCHGAHAAAIGAHSALRHLYPLRTGYIPASPGMSAFVPPLMTYHRLDVCQRMFGSTPDLSHLWHCLCPICDGTTPARLGDAENPDLAIFRHSLHAQLRLYAELTSRADTRERLVSTWHDHCSHAMFLHQQIAEEVVPWSRPLGLASWLAVTSDPLPDRTVVPQVDRQARVLSSG
jgi:hypothetical protein